MPTTSTTTVLLSNGAHAEIVTYSDGPAIMFWGDHGETHIEVEGDVIHELTYKGSGFVRSGNTVAFEMLPTASDVINMWGGR
jgi:hypothetical protein